MNRIEARAAAMKLIYEWEMGGDGGEDTLREVLEIRPDEAEYEYMQRMFEGVRDNAPALDERIQAFTQGWKIERLSRVDLAILRLAAYEIRLGQVPPAVIVNEAVELARIYSTDKAGSFVNGVLGSMARAEKD